MSEQFRKYREMEYRNLLIEFIKLLRPAHYLEIGVKKGYTFKELVKFVDQAVGVDPIELPNIANIPNVTFFKMTSQEFAQIYQGPKFDMIFIDGDHSKQVVIHDVVNICKQFIKPVTGLIFLHDTYPAIPDLAQEGYCHDAWEVARHIHVSREFSDFEIVTIPGPWAGLSIIRYVPDKQHLHWQEKKKDGRRKKKSSKSNI